jgi:hypothetical protein
MGFIMRRLRGREVTYQSRRSGNSYTVEALDGSFIITGENIFIAVNSYVHALSVIELLG